MEHGKHSEPDKEYQAEDDARTMMRAMEISKDKGRMSACMKQMKAQKRQMDSAMGMMGEMGAGKRMASMMKE